MAEPGLWQLERAIITNVQDCVYESFESFRMDIIRIASMEVATGKADSSPPLPSMDSNQIV